MKKVKIQTDRDKAAVPLEGSVEPAQPVDITVMTGKILMICDVADILGNKISSQY